MKLFEAKTYDYSDHDEKKPIMYDDIFFKELLTDCNEVEIQSEHDGEVIGHATNLYFKDGWLHGDIPVELKGKGLSPRFDVYLLDKGDYNLAREGTFNHIALTETPRNQILYNEKNKRQDKMSESNDVNEFLTKRVKELERELAVANNTIESNKSKLKEFDDLKKEVNELRKSNSEYETEIDANKDKASKWDNYVSNQKSALVDDLSENDAMREHLETMRIEDLKFLKENKVTSTDPKGVGNAGGQINDNDVPPEPTKDQKKEARFKEVQETYATMYGEE